MNPAAVTTPPKVSSFLKSLTAPAAPQPKTAPAPPIHRCPYCGNRLEAEEIAAKECWVCRNAIDPAIDIDEINPN